MTKANSIDLRLVAATHIPLLVLLPYQLLMSHPSPLAIPVLGFISAIAGTILWCRMAWDLYHHSNLVGQRRYLWYFILYVSYYVGATVYYFHVKKKEGSKNPVPDSRASVGMDKRHRKSKMRPGL